MTGAAAAPEPHPWSKDALIAKAQRFAEEMLTYDQPDWRFGFWSTLALEVLARAALSHISPVLLAEADWTHAYYAIGHTPTKKMYAPRSIVAGEVFDRLRGTVVGFTEEMGDFCKLHMSRRNEEVHTGRSAFTDLGTSRWLPTFFSVCEALLKSLGEDLELLLGSPEATNARSLIAAAKDESAKAIKKLVEAHRTTWGAQDEGARETLTAKAATWATPAKGHRVKCPACDSTALVTGSPAAPPKQTIKDDIITEKQSYLPSKFECVACGLRVGRLSELNVIGLGDSYTQTTRFNAAELYAKDDDFSDYEPDNNDPA